MAAKPAKHPFRPGGWPKDNAMRSSSMTKGRILVIDDSQADRMIISAGVRKMGHSVVACDDSEGWERLFERGERFDVVIIDMVMPRSGMDFVREILRQGFSCRVIGVSAGLEGRFDDLLDAEKRFASAVLTKPVDMDSLKEALELMLAARW